MVVNGGGILIKTAKVAVDRATFQFDKLYSYIIPDELLAYVQVGSMVLVPFGTGNHARMAVVLELEELEETPVKWKSLHDCVKETCILTGELLQLVYFLKEHTFCTFYDAVKTIIPYGAQYKAEGKTLKKQLTRTTERYYVYAETANKLTTKQALIQQFLKNKPATALEITDTLQVGKTVIGGLVKNGGALTEDKDKAILLYSNENEVADEVYKLSVEQQQVYAGLEELLLAETTQTALLHGVTGSGKTIVFLKLIEQVLQKGKQALVLVPEISLTPQMVYKLKSAFGDKVAVQHSALSSMERLLQWQQIQKGEAEVVVATRSGVFAPLKNIGIIIIDEEQESSYHSDQSPRYSAHEVALFRAKQHGALLLLSSATPSVETFYKAETGRYHLFEMNKRYGVNALPLVEIVDMRGELKEGNAGSISTRMADELAVNLNAGEQSIILLNRRGYQTVGMCTECGEILKCSDCSVPMVYHKKDNKLLCHYCGKTISPAPIHCPHCHGVIKYTGLGTQKVEEELSNLFPAARILRMDLDTTGKKNAHEKMLNDFKQQKYDIMIGTQMVAKGLDFPLVTLAGVIGIDQLLFAQSYKAYERVFSLVTQVVGRSGRSEKAGRALIQTLDPSNHIIHLAAQQDYNRFYEEEIGFRKLNLYPPFCNLCFIGFQGTDEHKVQFAAAKFFAYLREAFPKDGTTPIRILGPAPYPVVQVKNKFRYKLTLKCKNNKQFRSALANAMEKFSEDSASNAVQVMVDFYRDNDI